MRHIWEHYLHGRDIQFLQEYYPIMTSAADFLEDWMYENKDGKKQLLKTIELEVADDSQGRVTYSKTTRAILSGVYECAFRIYPKSKLLPHRQDLPLIKWV